MNAVDSLETLKTESSAAKKQDLENFHGKCQTINDDFWFIICFFFGRMAMLIYEKGIKTKQICVIFSLTS